MIPGKYHGYPPGITRENGLFYYYFANTLCTVMPFGVGGGEAAGRGCLSISGPWL